MNQNINSHDRLHDSLKITHQKQKAISKRVYPLVEFAAENKEKNYDKTQHSKIAATCFISCALDAEHIKIILVKV